MTCIIGAVCKDGIVLVADRRVLRGGEILSQNKITPTTSYPNTIVASSGTTEIMDYFLADVNALPTLFQQEKIVIDEKRGFSGVMEDIVKELYDRYAPRFNSAGMLYNFDVLFSTKIDNDVPPILLRIFKNGISRQVKTIEIIGSGEFSTLPFVKTAYNNEITMDEIAIIGSFSIKLSERIGLNISVGGTPQIWKLPNKTKPYEVSGDELGKVLKRSETLLQDFKSFLDRSTLDDLR
ncbi:MAG: hypothetical protein KAT65_18870 [Methanophagales archaeon]|nr:hypothetical protein [Methanophagales archaeon]